ncbi:Hypothetical protein I596_885 [Dokdonella koreensis DS-123]|uniref:Uncharacterized protein n=1 Tax=Dokdonella koreensis DS-123 TaxID=1300342 RepID=A0A167GP04_9GAMM|nr:Hypothetical protein I596_885 [Dokdonella koreensis DS-123]
MSRHRSRGALPHRLAVRVRASASEPLRPRRTVARPGPSRGGRETGRHVAASPVGGLRRHAKKGSSPIRGNPTTAAFVTVALAVAVAVGA